MIDPKLIIVVGNYEIESTVQVTENTLGDTEYLITTTCPGMQPKTKGIIPKNTTEYSDAQRDYDVEIARFEEAELVAGSAYQRDAAAVAVSPDQTPIRVEGGPRIAKP